VEFRDYVWLNLTRAVASEPLSWSRHEQKEHLARSLRWFAASLFVFSLLVSPAPTLAQDPQPSPALQAMKAELMRSLEALKSQPVPPYFLSYQITDAHTLNVSGDFGQITGTAESHNRLLGIDLRVGDYALDNTHPVRSGFPGFDPTERFTLIQVPVDDDPAAIRSILWFQTDRKFKRALEQLTKVKTNIQVKVAEEDNSADFSKEPAAKYLESPVPLDADARVWEEKIRKYSAMFAGDPEIYAAHASFTATAETRWFVNSEGSEIQTSESRYQLYLWAVTKAEDGAELPRYESFFAFSPQGLPDDTVVLQAVERMIRDLQALRKAPVVEPYTGPAILSGRASGVFFHEVFGHRIEGHRQRNEEEGQTFKKKVNEKILPDNFSVYFDPSLRRLGPTDLVGAFHFDDQGVRGRRVIVVDHGVFKNFLMSRTPIEGFSSSNGHGRNQAGFAPVARQSNLIVEVTHPVTTAELKKMLIEEVKRQSKPFGLWFEDIQGGFTMTGRTIPNAFNVLPVLVYRIYPDGREELVRGVDLIGTPLTAFSKLVAADNQVGVFNGICGAESGGVPVSAASPAVLVSQIEVQKKEKSQERPPILPAPAEPKK
jgi:TldD protein